MTYEQGGSGRAGLGIITRIGDTLTLKDRIAHHHTTGLSTVEVASKNVEKLNDEFKKFYRNKSFKYKSYVLNGDHDKIQALVELLDQHEIKYGSGNGTSIKGYNYTSGRAGNGRASQSSLVVSTNQTKGTLVKVLFEPDAKLSDSLTYDITAWSLPYAYGLQTIASESLVSSSAYSPPASSTDGLSESSYAFLTDWNSFNDAKFLAALMREKVKVRYSEKPFTLDGKNYGRGTLIITKVDNKSHPDLLNTLRQAASKYRKTLTSASTGFVENGKDFGSSSVEMIPDVKVAVLSGDPTSTLRFGEIWHFFERQLEYPVSVLDASYIKRVDLSKYDILILPEGYGYGGFVDETMLKQLKDWVVAGGKLIAMGRAIKSIDGEKGFGIKERKAEEDSTETTVDPFENSARERIQSAITGAIFKTKVDPTNPLAYGYGDTYFTLKLGSDSFDYLENGTAVYIEDESKPVSGFAGSKAQKKMPKTLVFGTEYYGRGQVVYMVDNPLFRGFWENGKLFFANALFMVD